MNIDIFAQEIIDETKEVEENLAAPTSLSLELEYSFEELSKRLFRPGTDVLFDSAQGAVCGRVAYSNETFDCFGRKLLSVSLACIQSLGTSFFKSSQNLSLAYFEGKRKLKDLPFRPVLAHEKTELKVRGAKFLKYGVGKHYLFNTKKVSFLGYGGYSYSSGEGRVMVDPATFLHFNPNYGTLTEGFHYGVQNTGISVGDPQGILSQDIPQSSLHLCWPTLCGFAFATKKWCEIQFDALEPIEFRDDAFEKLVLNPSTKALIRSLVEQSGAVFSDIIAGKGGGCIFLLHGPPGVGKTLTAEAVAEILHRPLYSIGVGELGVTPDALEKKLKEILEIAQCWDAVILLDEADIFLEARSKSDVLRNALVGIFLRLLEYHQGVLFLTSNRVEELDSAFQSRISVTVAYSSLDSSSRARVWSNLLEAAELKVEDIDVLNEYELNGRQIKTAIRLASSIAKSPGETFSTTELLLKAIDSQGGHIHRVATST